METEQASDNELIRAFQHGGKEAFRVLYSRYRDRAYFYALALTGRGHDAEEAVQEAFLAFVKNAGSYASRGSFQRYLFAAVRSRAIDLIRKEKTRREVFEGEPPDLFEKKEKSGRDTNRKVSEAILDLPEEQRETVILKVYDNMTFKEIASLTEVSENTAASRFRYGIEKLRTKLNGIMRDE